MKKKQMLTLLLALSLVLTLLTGCGGAAKSEAAVMPQEAPMEMAEAPAAADDILTSNSNAEAGTALPQSRKWIVTMYINAETEDLDAMTQALDVRIQKLGGYVEGQNVYNGSSYSSRRYRYADLTIRIPAEDADKFVEEMKGIANVISQEKNLEDVTLNYVSTESRMKALQTEEARLLEFMKEAQTMADLLEIEARLTDVRYELEAVTSRLRLYDNQIDYATIHLNIQEVQEYTPVEEPTVWERITTGFSDNLEGLGEGIVDFLVWVITSSPYLTVYGVLSLVLVLLIRRIRRTNEKRKAAKRADKQKDF